MKQPLTKLAAALAFVVGASAVAAGGKVLSGWRPGYNVISWLPLYNFAVGLSSVLVTSVLIWRNSRYALPAALLTLALHVAALAALLIAHRGEVAIASLGAMSFRIASWLAIAGLLLQARRTDVKGQRAA